MKRTILLCFAVSLCLLVASDPGTGDWPMWGGTPDRNMVSSMTGIPTSWDIQTKKNVKWVAELGTQTYGNPVVAGGQVYIGTNNESARNPKEAGDRGVLMCFRESDGQFLWQHTNAKLSSGDNDWPEVGVCSSPLVEGDRLYYVSNRCELVCLDTHGDGKGSAKVVWKFDMIKEVGVVAAQHVEFVAGVLRRSRFRQHLQRAGRESRTRARAARAIHGRGQQEDRQAGMAGEQRRRADSGRAVVLARGRRHRGRGAGGDRRGRRLGARL